MHYFTVIQLVLAQGLSCALHLALGNQCSLWILYLSAEEPVRTVDCCFTGAVITQREPLLLFSLTFGSSPLAAERDHLNPGLSWTVLTRCHVVFKILGLLISIIGEDEKGIKLRLQPTCSSYVLMWEQFSGEISLPTVCPEGLFITIKTALYFFSPNLMMCWLMKAVITAFHPSWLRTTWDQQVFPLFSLVLHILSGGQQRQTGRCFKIYTLGKKRPNIRTGNLQ